MSDGRWAKLRTTCQWCGTSLVAGDGVWTDPGNTGDYCPEGLAVGPTGTSPHLPALAAQAPVEEERLRNTVISEARHAAANNPAIATTGRLRLRAALDAYDKYRALGDESKEEGAGQRPPRLSGEPEEPHGLLSAGRNLSHSVGRRGVPRQGPRTRDTPS